MAARGEAAHWVRGALLALTTVLVVPTAARPQADGDRWLSFDQAFGLATDEDRARSPLSPLPRISGWLDASHYLERRDGRTYAVHVATGEATLHDDPSAFDGLLPAGMHPSDSAERSADGRTRIYTTGGDLWALDTVDRRFSRLTQTPLPEQNPRLSPDGRRLAYTRAGNLYV